MFTIRILTFFIIIFSSCGIIGTVKRDNFIRSKGFDPSKDTLIIKPYQFYIKHKGFVPIYRELNTSNKLNIKIGILGFENVDTIPFDRLFEPLTFVLSDDSYTIDKGELFFSRGGLSHTLHFGIQTVDSCMCNASFDFIKIKNRILKKGDLLFFWNVTVSKNGTNYLIPSKKYYFK